MYRTTNYPGDLVQTLGSGILVTSSTRASSRHLLVLVENHLFILIIYLHLNPSTYTYLSFSSNCLSAHLYLPTVKTYSVAKFSLSEKIVTVFNLFLVVPAWLENKSTFLTTGFKVLVLNKQQICLGNQMVAGEI